MGFPILDEAFRAERLSLPHGGRIRAVLDTDTYNEIDDQFALSYLALSREKIDLEAVYAAPFHNDRSRNAGDGMKKSYNEILRLADFLGTPSADVVFPGSKAFLKDEKHAQKSAAASDLISRAQKNDSRPLYVIAIGAITNVASALLLEPELVSRIVVVWLGGHGPNWPNTREFNLFQDIAASRVLLDSGVPLVIVPCHPVASHMITTLADVETHIGEAGKIGRYLTSIVRDYSDDHFAYGKVIWDIAPVGYVVNPDWVPSGLGPAPILNDGFRWSVDPSRHLIRTAYSVNRNAIFRDVYTKIKAAQSI